MNIYELSKRIFDCLSDGYDDEENRKEIENALQKGLEEIPDGSYIYAALQSLCEIIEELELPIPDHVEEKEETAVLIDGITSCCGYDFGTEAFGKNRPSFCPMCGKKIKIKEI